MAKKQAPKSISEILAPVMENYSDWVPRFAKWEELQTRLDKLLEEKKHSHRTLDRSRQGWRIDKEIAEVRADMEGTTPVYRFMFNDAAILVDLWKTFVMEWRDLQLQNSIPVGPTGKPLTESPSEEKEAWKRLISHMLPKGEKI